MGMGCRLHGHRDVRYPDILFVHGEGHPQVVVFRGTISLQDTTGILRTVALVVATIAHGRHLSKDEVQRGIFQSVLTEGDTQGPAIF